MAYENSIAVLPAHAAHPMANPGYGKRTAPAEPGAAFRPVDFSHLPAREAYIAAYVHRLPEGAAMDVKSLAKALPLYGQQAVRSALNFLSRAGHLHRVRGLAATGGDGTRWVFRTFWSSTAQDGAWWARLLGGEITVEATASVGDTPEVTPASEPTPAPHHPRNAPLHRLRHPRPPRPCRTPSRPVRRRVQRPRRPSRALARTRGEPRIPYVGPDHRPARRHPRAAWVRRSPSAGQAAAHASAFHSAGSATRRL